MAEIPSYTLYDQRCEDIPGQAEDGVIDIIYPLSVQGLLLLLAETPDGNDQQLLVSLPQDKQCGIREIAIKSFQAAPVGFKPPTSIISQMVYSDWCTWH